MRQERARCEVAASVVVARVRVELMVGPSGRDVASIIERERAHAAATALFVERVCIWLVRMAELGAAVAYHREMAAVKSAYSRRWLEEGP